MKLINEGKNDLFRFVIVVTLMLLMFFYVITLYIAHKPAVDRVNFAMQKQNFSRTLSLIRAQWLLEGRPPQIEFSFHDNGNNVINSGAFDVSKLGWASIADLSQPQYCRSLWAAVINIEPKESEQNTFIAAKYQKNDDIVCQICDAERRQNCFDYSIATGVAYPEDSNLLKDLKRAI